MRPTCPYCGYTYDHEAPEGRLYRCSTCGELFQVGEQREHALKEKTEFEEKCKTLHSTNQLVGNNSPDSHAELPVHAEDLSAGAVSSSTEPRNAEGSSRCEVPSQDEDVEGHSDEFQPPIDPPFRLQQKASTITIMRGTLLLLLGIIMLITATTLLFIFVAVSSENALGASTGYLLAAVYSLSMVVVGYCLKNASGCAEIVKYNETVPFGN